MSDVRIPIILGVTGHRDLKNKDTDILRDAVKNFLSNYRKIIRIVLSN